MERGAGRRASREGGRLWIRLLALAGVFLLDCDTGELCSDRLSHFRPDAGDTLDPVGRSRELVKRGDVVPLQNSPGLLGQTQTWNGTFTNLPGVIGRLPRLLPSGCRAGGPAQMAGSAGDTFLDDLFHRCGKIPDVERADGAAPPNEGSLAFFYRTGSLTSADTRCGLVDCQGRGEASREAVNVRREATAPPRSSQVGPLGRFGLCNR
jgi:hypothetical protein